MARSATIVISIISFFVALGALLWTLFFSGSSDEVQVLSALDREIDRLAAGQNYTSTTVLDDPLVVYLDDFLSLAEVDEILNIRWERTQKIPYVVSHIPHTPPLSLSLTPAPPPSLRPLCPCLFFADW